MKDRIDPDACRQCGTADLDPACVMSDPDGRGPSIPFCRDCWDGFVVPLERAIGDRIKADPTFAARFEAEIDKAEAGGLAS